VYENKERRGFYYGQAISTLSDDELARLASRADKLDQDFAAGRLSDRGMLIVILGAAALLLIIVAARR
jgi:hypothetical protein